MSNLAGSYKVGVGEGQGHNLREQERRARHLLLDVHREPSPQPIFGEPVKVEQDDATALRIKKTLGDVSQVLINDPKSPFGISRSAPNSVYPSNGHQISGHPSNSHPVSGLPSNSHPMSGHPSNSHQISGHTNSHSMSVNSSNSHIMCGISSNSHSMSGHQPSSHPMSGHSSNGHLVSSHQTNTHLLSGHQSNPHPFTGHQTIAHSIAGHQTNTHPITGHPSNTHPMAGHPSSSHPITGHPSNSHLISGHTSSNHQITGHPSNSHLLTGHTTNSHLITGHPNNSHPTTGHPSNSHPIPGHTTGGLPSNGYHMTGHPVNVHPIPGHPSNGHPISGYSGAGHVNAPSRPQAASKKVPIPANNTNMSKPSDPNMPNMFPKLTTDKRNSYNRQKPDSPVTSKPFHTSSFNSIDLQHQVVQPHYQAQDNRSYDSEEKKTSNLPFAVNLNFSGGTYNNVTIGDINVHSGTTSAPIWSYGPETPAIQVTPFHLPPCVTPSTANKPVYNIPGMQQIQKFDNNTSPVKRPVNRPSHLKIERKPTSPIGVETILKEMTKPVPAPLTAIQTPRTEETGFAFPPEPKEESKVVKTEEKANPSNVSEEEKSSYICQQSPDYTSSLQDDLEMSESDEEAVPDKKEDASEFLSAPSNPVTVNNNNPLPAPVSIANMETNSASSSSSESGDSDSDDDSSESNNSDSSSESSDEDTSSMKWGLSNFVDESRRNHSPAFRNLEMQKQLNCTKPVSSVCPQTLKENFSPPVSQPLNGFIVADTPVTAKSEILSPIRSPTHPIVGPRTPPSPTSPLKDLSDEGKSISCLNDSKSEPSIESKSPDSVLDTSNENKTLLSSTPIACDENKGNTIADTSDILSSEVGSSPLNHLSTDNKECKDISRSSSEKDTSLSDAKSSPPASDAFDSSSENYSIKTRQKCTTSTKKTKPNIKKATNSNQNEDGNSPPIAKFKHPRACRKSTEKLAVSPSPAKPEQVKEPPKKRSKPAIKQKEISSNEKTKAPLKSASSPKKPAKANVKQKAKANKTTSKISNDKKKGESKNRKKKFVVENFLQSPTPSNENNISSLHSPPPSPDDLPASETKKHSDTTEKQSIVNTSTSKNTVRNNSKSSSKGKAGEKLRRSARCSERASSLSQSEPPTTPKQSAEHSSSVSEVETSTPKSSSVTNKKAPKKLVKSKSHVENLPISIDPPLQILSPIPHESPQIASTSDTGNRKKIIVSIPLSKLKRIPSILNKIQESDARTTSKSLSVSSIEDIKQKKDLPSEKSLKHATNRCSQIKDFKDKPRTVQASKNCKKNVSNSKKDNTSKPVSESASKNASSVNRNSAKVSDKVICDVENKLPKKRKSEDDTKQMSKKKPKLSSRSTEEKKSKEQISGSKVESTATQNDGGGKPKPLERCDSASSLNSICSQRSSKVSKEKKDSVIHESKRLKMSASSIVPIKEIKQEKEDRSKVHIKKEPISTLDKCMKSRDKSSVTDIDCKEKIDAAFNEILNSSSQYINWENLCKEESKVPLESILDSTMNWDHYSLDMHKELKDSSTLKMLTDQNPIMPMDYYWTEGRKMKKMAEMEKDMFQQAVKYFEAAVLYILTSQQKEENSKNPDAVYQFYYETLQFTSMMLAKIKKLQSCPGSTEFKLLILCLKCQSLLNVKLYSLKIKEIKEQLECVADFFRAHCSSPADTPNPNLPSLHQSRISSLSTVSSPHSVIPPSPNSVSSQTSGYVSGDVGSNIIRNTVCVPQYMLDTIHRQHSHLKNLHMGHDLWEQADMYMTRSNLKEFFKEVADQSEPLTLHSSIKELVSYMQKGIGLVKNYLR